MHKQQLSISEACQILRKQKQLEVADRAFRIEKTTEDIKTLVHIGKIRNRFWVYSELPLVPQTQEEMWIVLRNYVNEQGQPGHRISENDVLKMGRCKYSVKELVTVPQDSLPHDNFDRTCGGAESPHVVASPPLAREIKKDEQREQMKDGAKSNVRNQDILRE